MQGYLRCALIMIALMAGENFVFAAESLQSGAPGDPQRTGNEPTSPVPNAISGTVPVGPIGASGDTMPAKYSTQNDADDKLPLGAYRLKHLTQAERLAIYRGLTREQTPAATAESDMHLAVGNLVPSAVVLSPMPDDVAAQVQDTKGLQFVATHDKVVLVDPLDRMVVGVLPD